MTDGRTGGQRVRGCCEGGEAGQRRAKRRAKRVRRSLDTNGSCGERRAKRGRPSIGTNGSCRGCEKKKSKYILKVQNFTAVLLDKTVDE